MNIKQHLKHPNEPTQLPKQDTEISEKSRLCSLTQEEVDSYLQEKNIKVSVMMKHGYNKDDDWAEEIRDDQGYFVKFGDDCVRTEKLWGFSGPNGFHTFSFEDPKMTEIKAQYMTVLFHKLHEEYDVSWASAEALSLAYVMSDFEVPHVLREKRSEPDMSTEEGQEEVRKKLLDCIRSGNIVVPSNVTVPQAVEDMTEAEIIQLRDKEMSAKENDDA